MLRVRGHATGTALLSGLAAVLAACGAAAGTGGSSGGGPAATGAVPSQGSGCVSQSEARQIWTDIDNRINAMEADPKHATPSSVTSGAALNTVEQYLAATLRANNWTEHEVDRLDSLSVVNAGCNNGPLELRVTITLVTDEYITAGGQIDHHDPSEGQQQHLSDSYARDGGVWKETNLLDLDAPSPQPTGQII